MNDIRRVLRRAAWRVWLMALGRALTVAASAVLAGLIVLRLVQQASGLAVPWVDVAIWSAVGAVVLAVAWTIISRADRAAVARRVDEGADLREALSTALCIERNQDAWSRVALETAAERARAVDVRRAVPMQPPRFWPVPLALAMSLLVVWIAVQPMDLFGNIARAKQEEQDQARIMEVQAKSDEAIKKVESMMAKLEQGQKMEALEKMLKQLRTPGEGPLTELSKELSKGNFKQAAEELEKLAEKMNANQLSDEDKKALSEQIKKLQEQLDKLAQERSDL